MAKALLGYVGVGHDERVAAEVRRLHRKVRELEDELARSRALNDALLSGLRVSDIGEDIIELTKAPAEPALT